MLSTSCARSSGMEQARRITHRVWTQQHGLHWRIWRRKALREPRWASLALTSALVRTERGSGISLSFTNSFSFPFQISYELSDNFVPPSSPEFHHLGIRKIFFPMRPNRPTLWLCLLPPLQSAKAPPAHGLATFR